MNSPLFEANLRALEIHDPALASRVAQTSLDGFSAEFAQSKRGAATLKVLAEGQQRPVLLHSAYDPVREAQRWNDALEFSEPTNIIVLGMGLGYHLVTFLKQHEYYIRFLFVVERDIRIFRVAMMLVDIRALLSRSGVQFFVGEDPPEIPERIGEKRTDIILHNCKIFTHDQSLSLYPQYYQNVRETILQTLTHDEINLRTSFENQGRGQFNILMNIPALYRGYRLKDCANLFQGYPAVVMAAGPSLDKNIHLVKEIQDRAVLLIVDTAQTTCKKHGIVPDAVVTGDPTPLNFRHFDGIDSMGDSFLVFHPESNRQISQKYINHPYLLPLFDTNSALLNHLFAVEEKWGTSTRAMNVGHLAYHFAELLGCGPLILIGFDFAFPKHGGKTHAADAAVSRGMSKMEADGRIDIEGKADMAPEETGQMRLVPGYHGDRVPTTVPFEQYILALQRSIAESKHPVIDATEGGAKFEGAIQMPFEEAIRLHLKQPGVAERWHSYKQTRLPDDPDALKAKLNEGKTLLHQSRNDCLQMLKHLSAWDRLIALPTLDRNRAESEWQAFEQLWMAMVSNPLFDTFLGSSVHYLYFRRQRQLYLDKATPQEYLRCLQEKYVGILNEMDGVLEQFCTALELSIASFEASLSQ